MRIFLLLKVVIVIAACGEKPKTHRDSATVLPVTTDDAFADRYFVSDAACQTGIGAATIGKPQVHVWKDGAVQLLPFPVEGIGSIGSLNGGGIDTTIYSLTQRTTCTVDGGVTDCSSGAILVKKPQNLQVCTTSQSFARTSIEGVALSSLASLSLAREFYQSLEGRDQELQDVILIVLPTIETVVQDRLGEQDQSRRKVITDNLAYAPDFGGNPAFVVFPKGRKSVERGLWKNLNLWEMGWGMAHEFGHHVFRQHLGLDQSNLMQMMPIHSFDSDQDKNSVRIQKTAAANITETSLGAINEGFADLFGYYTYGGAAALTQGIDCFEKSRDVASPTFFNGEAKKLSRSVLEQFYGIVQADPGSCTTPSYDDIHIIGAVVAHGIDRLLKASPEWTDRGRKTSLLLQWAAAMGLQLRMQASSDLGSLLEEFVRLLSRSGQSLTVAQCQVIREVFPGFAGEWIGNEGQFRCLSAT